MSAPELALLMFSVFYGPVLFVVAIAIYASTIRPARRGASWIERRARAPLFWATAPLVVAAGMLLVIGSTATAPEAVAAAPSITLTKNTTTHFTQSAATLSRYINPASDQLTLFSSLAPSTVATIGPLMPYATGAGAHAVESSLGEYLVLHGGGQNVSSVISPITTTTLVGPSFTDSVGNPVGVGKGAFSIARGDGTFLLVMGGDTDTSPLLPSPQLEPLTTQIVTPAATLGGTWTAAPGPSLAGATGAGFGAHAVQFTVSGITKYLIVHAGGGIKGTSLTSIYTPPQGTTTESMVAGPTTTSAAGAGATSVPRTDGTFFIVFGSGTKSTAIYTPPTTTTGIGSFAAGPLLGGTFADGTYAIQYNNSAGQARYAIVQGGANSATVYDPAAVPGTTAGILGTLSIPAPTPAKGCGKVSSGANGYLRPDGTVVGFFGCQEVLEYLFTPTASSVAPDLLLNGQFTSLAITNTVPMDVGSFVIHQRSGSMLIFAGSAVETRVNDAGWALSGTYTSEPLNPGNLDQWTSISWTRGATDLTLKWRAARSADLLPNSSYTTVNTSTGLTGTVAVAPGTTNKWMQVQISFQRSGTSSTGAEANVWLGGSSVVQLRALSSTAPVLSSYALAYTGGSFVLSARSPEISGIGFPLTVELRDSANLRIPDYQGNHTLTFAGPSVGPDGVSTPTVRDRGGNDVAVGQPTPLTFQASGLSVGTAVQRTFLYKREEIDLTATETVTYPGPSVAFTLSTYTLTTKAPSHLVVNAGAPSGTKSTLSASPATVKPNGSDASTLTLTATDAAGNSLPGLRATLSSDRGSADTFALTTLAPTDLTGKASTTLTSLTRGTANVTATIQSPPAPVGIPQRFFGTATTAFRAGPTGSVLWQAPTTVPAGASLASTLSYGAGLGSRQVMPGTASSTAASPGTTATNKGWRDESYARATQGTTAGQLSGDWTFTYSLALTSGAQSVTGQMTVVVYAVDASNSTREIFRNTTPDLSIGPAELNYQQTFTPAYAVQSAVAGYLAAGEILQYELFLNISLNPNAASVVQFRAGAAGTQLAPPDIEAGTISDLPSATAQTAVTPATKVFFFGGAALITLSKSTASHFAAGTAGTGVTTSSSGIGLGGAAATTATTGTLPVAIGDGAHTLAGNGGELMVVNAGGTTATTIYSPTGTTSAGPSFGGPIGQGGFAFPISGGYIVVAGGGSFATYVVTPAATPGGTWTIALGPALAGATGAGGGAHALTFTSSGTTMVLVVHGGGTALTSLYSSATGLFSAGPALLANAGAGAHAIARGDGKFLIVLGNASTATNVFDPVASSYAAGPTLASAVGAGGHAVLYTNGSGLSRALIVAGNGSTASAIYDPSAPVGAGISAGPALPSAVGAGANSLERADGAILILAGGGTTTAAVFTPSTEAAASATITPLPAIAAGGHAFQRNDGLFVVVAGGGTSLATYDAGWTLSGTYTTEALGPSNGPSNVDHWDTASWTLSGPGTVTIAARVATTQTGLSSAAYTTLASTQSASGSSLIGGAVGSRSIQLQVSLARTIPASTGVATGVWLGSSSVVQNRTRAPFVTKLSLVYLSGAFTISASATQTAGAANVATISLRDSANTVITDYGGSHTMVFAGAATAPDGVSQPKASTPTSAGPSTVAFGGGTALTFNLGQATTSLTLYKAETATVSASETASASSGTSYDLTAYTMDVSAAAPISVAAAAASAANSSATASPTTVPADNTTTAAISVRLKDAYQNPLVGITTITLGSYGTVAGDRAAYDTLVNPTTTDTNGLGTGRIRSTRFGTATITLSVGGGALAIPSPPTVTFKSVSFSVTTQHGGTETAGVGFTLTITALDASGATVTSYTGSKTITFTTTSVARTSPVAGPSAVITTPQLVTFTNGVGMTSGGVGSACNQPAGISCLFTLYNSGETPFITATDDGFPSGTSSAITVVPASVSLGVSTFVANPTVVAPDGKDTASLTVQVMDAFGNPVSGKTVTFSTTFLYAGFIQPPNPTASDGIAIGQINGTQSGTAVVTAAITGVGNLTTQQTITLVPGGKATRVLVVRTQHTENETAGVPFSITISGITASGTIDKNFCGAASCSVSLTNTALPAPDGTVPTGTINLPSPNFVNGTYTTNATDNSLVTFFRANQDPLPSITVNVNSPSAAIVGATPGIRVATGSVNTSNSYVYSVPDLIPADGTTTGTLGAKVLDNWKNPISGKSVTFKSSRPTSDTITQPTVATGALGITFGTISSSVATDPDPLKQTDPVRGVATITGTVTGVVPDIALKPNVTFFGSPGGGKIQNGTSVGSVVNGTATNYTLAMTARDLGGTQLADTTLVSWTVRGTGDGTLTTTTTTSGAGASHATQFTATRAGNVTITGGYVIPSGSAGAGTEVTMTVPLTVVSQFDVKVTTTNGRIVIARVEWDGTALRTISWTTQNP